MIPSPSPPVYYLDKEEHDGLASKFPSSPSPALQHDPSCFPRDKSMNASLLCVLPVFPSLLRCLSISLVEGQTSREGVTYPHLLQMFRYLDAVTSFPILSAPAPNPGLGQVWSIYQYFPNMTWPCQGQSAPSTSALSSVVPAQSTLTCRSVLTVATCSFGSIPPLSLQTQWWWLSQQSGSTLTVSKACSSSVIIATVVTQ